MLEDAASERSSRLLWTGAGFAALMLIGISASALVPPAPHASAEPCEPSHGFAPVHFAPTRLGRSTAIRGVDVWAGGSLPVPRGQAGFNLRQALQPRARARAGSTKMMAGVGDQVPDFSLLAHTGETITPQVLKDSGKRTLIWAYPKADTGG